MASWPDMPLALSAAGPTVWILTGTGPNHSHPNHSHTGEPLTYSQRRNDHMVLGAATVLILLVGLLAAAPATAGAAEDTDDTQQQLAQMRAAHAGGNAADPGVTAQSNHPSECFADGTGDTVDHDTDLAATSQEADIVEHCVGFEDSLNLNVEVAAPTNPATDPNWEGATFVGWFVDTDGDGEGDYFVNYSLNTDAELEARVSDLTVEGSPVNCTVDALFGADKYHAGPIPDTCIGAPETVTVSVAVFYNEGGESGTVYRDTAPDGGAFTDAVAKDDGICTDPLPAPFADREDIADVHVDNVDCLFARGIIQGTTGDDGVRRFLPRPNVTRAQFAAFTFRTLMDAGVALPDAQEPGFDDVSTNFPEEIHRLAAAEILEGYAGTNLFGPQNPIRRDQTASVLVRASEHAENQALPADNPGTYFSDTVGNFHEDNIDAAFELGLVTGVVAPNPPQRGLYAPAAHTTRQQMASVLARFLRNLDGATQ